MWKCSKSTLKNEKVDYELLCGVVKRHLKFIEAYYDKDTEAAEKRSKEVAKDIEGPAPKIKPVSVQQQEKNKKRAMKQLNKLFL